MQETITIRESLKKENFFKYQHFLKSIAKNYFDLRCKFNIEYLMQSAVSPFFLEATLL